MKTNRFISAALSLVLAMSSAAAFGTNLAGTGVGRPGSNSASQHRSNSSASRPGSSSARPSSSSSRPSSSSSRPSSNMKPASSAKPATTRPATQNKRPGTTTIKPSGSSKPSGNSKPSGGSKPGTAVKPGTSSVTRPGSSHSVRPGTSHNNRPGSGSAHKPGHASRPGNSYMRPGTGSLTYVYRPPVIAAPRPPRPVNLGWYNPFPGRWVRWVPLPPPRPVAYFTPIVSPFTSFLSGVVFGTLISSDITTLEKENYNVAATSDDAIYLDDVSYLGFEWPQVTINYSDKKLSSAVFSYTSLTSTSSRYYAVLAELTDKYGAPHSTTNKSGIRSATWWDDANGYVTLESGSTAGYDSGTVYYTDLIIGK